MGDGPEAGYGTLRGNALRRLGYVAPTHEDVVRFMAAADVLVLPSYSEGLPTVLVEAGALGLPVIASSVGGIPELLGHDRGTPCRMSRRRRRGLARRFLVARERAGAAASRLRAHVSEAYDVNTNAVRLMDCYRSVGGVP